MKSKLEVSSYNALIEKVLQIIEGLDGELTAEAVHEPINKAFLELDIKPKQGLLILRHSLTATEVGAGVFQTMQVIGLEGCIKRLKASISK